MNVSDKEHYSLVEAFMRMKRREEPEKFREVTEKYPVVTASKRQTQMENEIPVGLLGLQPSAISPEIAHKYGLESRYDQEDE